METYLMENVTYRNSRADEEDVSEKVTRLSEAARFSLKAARIRPHCCSSTSIPLRVREQRTEIRIK